MKAKPRLLDLFCCEGGAAKGYQDAGWDVEGVDFVARFRKRYPGRFILDDALDFAAAQWRHYDAIHASPPCHLYSITNASRQYSYPDLVAPTRHTLQAIGKPYVIENVAGAPLIDPVTLCGSMFGLTATDTDGHPLRMERHRLFESNVSLVVPGPCDHDKSVDVAGAYQGARARRGRTAAEHRYDAKHVRHGGYVPPKDVQEDLMGIDWMTLYGLAQSLPPVYTQWVGLQLRKAVA